ncbi:MAG: hypothetical protein Ta2B_02460 [Termitinemataceae bacterium]|nr:MAG: hypothetical protein Ta2B_02460 [Termitinemataceae bacterium]
MRYCLQRETEKGYIQMAAKTGEYTDDPKEALSFNQLWKANSVCEKFNAEKYGDWEVSEL